MSFIKRVIKKTQYKPFMEAVVAGCAMVAFADGIVRPEEKDKLIEFFRLDDRLQIFEAYEAIEAFERHEDTFEFDARVGREKALEKIDKIQRRSEEARMIILVCIAVAKADDEYDNNQILSIRDICKRLGFNPQEFDLNLRSPSLADVLNRRPPPLKKREPESQPDWMKHPEAHVKKASEKKAEEAAVREKENASSKKKEKMPDWMEHQPELEPVPLPPPSSAKKEKEGKEGKEGKMPDWMKHPPEPAPKPVREPSAPASKKPANMPDWMRHPPKPSPQPPAQKNDAHNAQDAPEWMRDTSKIRIQKMPNAEEKEEIPEWMKRLSQK